MMLTERIEATFDRAIEQRRLMEYARWTMRGKEEDAKAEHADEWSSAKNNDVRAVLLRGWLAGDEEYEQARDDYHRARLEYRVALLKVERFKLLVEASKGGAS